MVINKYVTMNSSKGIIAVVFSDNIQHADIANGRKVRSAGWVRVFEGNVKCYGDSESLGKKALPEDTEIIARMIFGHESIMERCGKHDCVCHDARISQSSNACMEGRCRECEGNIEGEFAGACGCHCHGLEFEH